MAVSLLLSEGSDIQMFPTPEHEMEKVLYAADELTGLLGAVMPGREPDTLIARTLRAMQESAATA